MKTNACPATGQLEAVNLARNWLDPKAGGWGMTNEGVRLLAEAVVAMNATLVISRSDYFHEAANTLKANGWTLLLARLFGKRILGFDTTLDQPVKLVSWRGTRYML
jgi:hypothetical protein